MSGLKPARDDDTWLHHIIAGGAVRATPPQIKVRYLQDRIDRVADRPWQGEISGRLLSLCDDIAGFAMAVASQLGPAPVYRFRGVAHATVSAIRTLGLDVLEDPTPTDRAHAIIAIRDLPLAPSDGPVVRPSQEFVVELARLFSYSTDADVAGAFKERYGGSPASD